MNKIYKIIKVKINILFVLEECIKTLSNDAALMNVHNVYLMFSYFASISIFIAVTTLTYNFQELPYETAGNKLCL